MYFGYPQNISVWHARNRPVQNTDYGLGIKQGLGITWGLWTEYKTRTTDYVYKNSFRKVKLREKENGLA